MYADPFVYKDSIFQFICFNDTRWRFKPTKYQFHSQTSINVANPKINNRETPSICDSLFNHPQSHFSPFKKNISRKKIVFATVLNIFMLF